MKNDFCQQNTCSKPRCKDVIECDEVPLGHLFVPQIKENFALQFFSLGCKKKKNLFHGVDKIQPHLNISSSTFMDGLDV